MDQIRLGAGSCVAAALCALLLTASCASFRHGFTERQYRGQVLPADSGPGAERLEMETGYDPTVRHMVETRGAPDYIQVVSAREVLLVYVDAREILHFRRGKLGTESEVEIEPGIPESIAVFMSPQDRDRFARADDERRLGAPGRRTDGFAEDPANLELGRYHALLIGNADHRYLPRLETPVNDVRALANLLREAYGFEVTVLENSGRGEIVSALASMRHRLRPDDNLLRDIRFAGHDGGDFLFARQRPERTSEIP